MGSATPAGSGIQRLYQCKVLGNSYLVLNFLHLKIQCSNPQTLQKKCEALSSFLKASVDRMPCSLPTEAIIKIHVCLQTAIARVRPDCTFLRGADIELSQSMPRDIQHTAAILTLST